MLDTVKINHVQHISFTQSRLTDAVSVILSELLSYEHPPKKGETNVVVTTTHLYQSRVRRNIPHNPHRYHQEKPATSGIYL